MCKSVVRHRRVLATSRACHLRLSTSSRRSGETGLTFLPLRLHAYSFMEPNPECYLRRSWRSCSNRTPKSSQPPAHCPSAPCARPLPGDLEKRTCPFIISPARMYVPGAWPQTLLMLMPQTLLMLMLQIPAPTPCNSLAHKQQPFETP